MNAAALELGRALAPELVPQLEGMLEQLAASTVQRIADRFGGKVPPDLVKDVDVVVNEVLRLVAAALLSKVTARL